MATPIASLPSLLSLQIHLMQPHLCPPAACLPALPFCLIDGPISPLDPRPQCSTSPSFSPAPAADPRQPIFRVLLVLDGVALAHHSQHRFFRRLLHLAGYDELVEDL